MANFKKGIALALVATTAFTFAPVATYTAPVVAEAAVTTIADDIKLGLGTSVDKTSDLADDGFYTVTSDVLFEGLTITATNTENAQNVNVLNTGKKFKASTAALTISATATAKTGQTTTLTITEYKDATDTAEVVKTTTYKITAANLSGVKLYSSAAGAQSAVALESSVKAGSTITAKSFEQIDPAGNSTGAAQNLAAGSLSLKSSNDSIATVTQNANAGYDIKGVSVGTTTVYVYDETNKKVLGNFEIKVTQGAAGSLGNTVDAKKGAYGYFVTDTTKTNALNVTGTNAATATMDPISDNKLQLVYGGTDYSAFTYYSTNSTVATVDATGLVTAVKSGTADIHVIGQANANYLASTDFVVTVTVTAGTDKITVKNGDATVTSVNLDLANSTAPNAVKSAQLIATSVTGAPVKWTVSDANGNAAASSAISVSDTGLVTSLGNVPTTAYVTAYTEKTETVPATKKTITVNIYALPEADFDVPATVALNYADKTSENVKVAYDGTLNISIAKDVDSNAGGAVTNFVTNGKNDWTIKLANTATKTLGTDVVTVTAPEVAGKTRMTTKTFKVVVTENAVAKKASDLTVESTSVVAKVGETVTIGAKATNEVTYTSADESVATVSADGVVTAVKAGQTVVTVKAAESDTMEAATITVPVVVTEEAKPVVIAKPAKVKSVTAKAVKGGKVKFTAKKVAKAAGYQFVYTVGKKTVKKTTTKTTLTVKIGKGKKATVKVRAYNYKNGTTKQYGAFSAKKSVKASK